MLRLVVQDKIKEPVRKGQKLLLLLLQVGATALWLRGWLPLWAGEQAHVRDPKSAGTGSAQGHTPPSGPGF